MKTTKKIILATISTSMLAAPALSVITSCSEDKLIINEPTEDDKVKAPSEGLWYAQYTFSLRKETNLSDINITITSSTVNGNETTNFAFVPTSTDDKKLVCYGFWLELPNQSQTITFDIQIENVKSGKKQEVKGLSLKYTFIGHVQTLVVKQLPTTTSYKYDDELSLDGLIVTATYDSGKVLDVPYVPGVVRSIPAVGEQLQTKEKTMPISVSVDNVSTSFEVDITAIPLSADIQCSISSFCVGDTIYKENLFITANYSDETISMVDEWTSDPVIPEESGYKLTSQGSQKFKIYHKNYADPITSIVLDVGHSYIDGISVKAKKTQYKPGEKITKDDFEVIFEWSDGTTTIAQNYTTDIELPYTVTSQDAEAGNKTIRFSKGENYQDVTVNVAKRVINDVKISFNTEKFGVGFLLNPNDFNISATFDGSSEYVPLSYGTGLDQFSISYPTGIDFSQTRFHTITLEEAQAWKDQQFKFLINGTEYTAPIGFPATTAGLKYIYNDTNPKNFRAGQYLTEENIIVQARYNDSENKYKFAYCKDTLEPIQGFSGVPYQFTLDDARETSKYIGFKSKNIYIGSVGTTVKVSGATIDKIVVKPQFDTVLVDDVLKPENLGVIGILTGDIKRDTLEWNQQYGYKIFHVKDDGSEEELTKFNEGFVFEQSGEYTFKVKATSGPAAPVTFTIGCVETGDSVITFVPGEEALQPISWTEQIEKGDPLTKIAEEKRTPSYDTTRYEFLGWSKTKNGEIINIDEPIFASRLTLYAVYKPLYVKLTYCVNVDVIEPTKISIVQSAPQSTPPDLNYSIDGTRWYSLSAETSFEAGTHLYLRGYNTNGFSRENEFNTIKFNGGKVELSGNITSLLTNGEEITEAEKAKAFITPYGFARVFQNNTAFNTLPEYFLQVPGTAANLFDQTFAGCTNLYACPDLVDTECDLSAGTFHQTFKDCTSLMLLPNNLVTNGFKANNYPQNCYNGTFENCVQLDSPIPFGSDTFNPTTLGVNAFTNMYKGCVGLQVTTEKRDGYKQIMKLGNVPDNVFTDMFSQYGKGLTPKANQTWYAHTNSVNGVLAVSITPLELKTMFRKTYTSKSKDLFMNLKDFNAKASDEWTESAGYIQHGNHFEYNMRKENDDYRHTYQNIRINFLVQPYTTMEVTVNVKLKTWCHANGSILFTPTWTCIAGELFDYGTTVPPKEHFVGTPYGLHEGNWERYPNKPKESIFADGTLSKLDFTSHSTEKNITLKFMLKNETNETIIVSRYYGLSNAIEGNMEASSEICGDKKGNVHWYFTIS